MLNVSKIEEFIYQYCSNVQPKENGWIMKCPFCGDSKKNPNKRRFHLDYFKSANKYTFFCYNGGCNESGDVYTLYSHLKGITYSQARKELDENAFSSDKIKKQFKKKKEEKKEVKKVQTIDISSFGLIGINSKPESKRLQRYQIKLKEFLEDRCLDIECWIATEGKFENRIIIPLFENNKLVYFQGRRMFSSMSPKYLNPVVDKSHIIPNIKILDINKTVIVTEGILDMYSVNNNNVTCCLGAYISDDFLKRLFDKVKGDVIIALDNFKIDEAARKQIIKMIEESKYGKRLKYFHIPYNDIKDLNEMKQKKDINDIYQFVIDNSFSYLKTKLILNKLNVGKNHH